MSKTAKLAALQKRLAFLEGRITARCGNAPEAWAEHAALRWAVPILADVVARNVERAEDVHHQRRDSAYALLANTAVEQLALRSPDLAAELLARCGDPHVATKVLAAMGARWPGHAWQLQELMAEAATQ